MTPDIPTSDASVDLYTVNMQKGYKRNVLRKTWDPQGGSFEELYLLGYNVV